MTIFVLRTAVVCNALYFKGFNFFGDLRRKFVDSGKFLKLRPQWKISIYLGIYPKEM